METSTTQLLKLWLMHSIGLSRDALHIYVGLIVFFASAFVLRRQIGTWLPVLAVALVAIVGELFDLRDDLNTFGYWRWYASLHDIVNTLFWPALISLLAHTRLFARGGQ